MKCIQPITIKNKRTKENIQVACGNCINCRINKQTYYEFIAKCEVIQCYREKKSCCFVTLTYNENNVPLSHDKDGFINYTLKKEDVQKFWKRVRIELQRYAPYKELKKIKHITIGEMGEEANRPHYHAIVFGIDKSILAPIIRKEWKYGFTECDALGSGGIRYVVDYVLKNQTGKEIKKKIRRKRTRNAIHVKK